MVAVKTSLDTEGEGAEELCREATVMAQVTGHPNLVSLVGVVTSGAPLLLLVSLCENGSVLDYLKEKRSVMEKMQMACEIAMGMEHLTGAKFIHRDLAARNVLVDVSRTCKVADFGLSRATTVGGAANAQDASEDTDGKEDYYRSQHGVFPVRWTTPESMETLRFTVASDVWSYGVTVLEIYQDGTRPYADKNNAAVITHVMAGLRAERPEGTPMDMYKLMLDCWSEEPHRRPTFTTIVTRLVAMGAGTKNEYGINMDGTKNGAASYDIDGDGEYNMAGDGAKAHDEYNIGADGAAAGTDESAYGIGLDGVQAAPAATEASYSLRADSNAKLNGKPAADDNSYADLFAPTTQWTTAATAARVAPAAAVSAEGAYGLKGDNAAVAAPVAPVYEEEGAYGLRQDSGVAAFAATPLAQVLDVSESVYTI